MTDPGIDIDKTLALAGRLGLTPVLEEPVEWYEPLPGPPTYRDEPWLHGTSLHDAVRLARGRPKVRRRWGADDPTLRSLEGLYLYDSAREMSAEYTAVEAGQVFAGRHGFSRGAMPTILSLRLDDTIRPDQVALDEDELFEICDLEALGEYTFVLWGSEAEKRCIADGVGYIGFDSARQASSFRGSVTDCEGERVANRACRRELDRLSRSMGKLVTEHGYSNFKLRILPPFRVTYWGVDVRTVIPPQGVGLDAEVDLATLYGKLSRR